ncbi:hypothetical protein BVC80_9077g5 [Macleaya cordata]|uniref:Zinc finger protein n=1 Tax=Macleaya cordata TaxID=56857 RepID=A0A200PLK1_MACCD|nr:hypothetical protein BVC80_9077g5 [Macleaya cordata]
MEGPHTPRASDYPREYDGACLQMRLSYSPASRLFLFLVQWTDCNLACALGFLRILIYKAYVDGKTTMSIQERKASIREFYTVIFPSLLQLERGITDMEDEKQRDICATKYKKKVEMDKCKMSEIDVEREEECGICMEMNFKVVLPNCNHSLCMKCYRDCIVRLQYSLAVALDLGDPRKSLHCAVFFSFLSSVMHGFVSQKDGRNCLPLALYYSGKMQEVVFLNIDDNLMAYYFFLASGMHVLNRAPSVGIASEESTQVIFGSTPTTVKFLTFPRSARKT